MGSPPAVVSISISLAIFLAVYPGKKMKLWCRGEKQLHFIYLRKTPRIYFVQVSGLIEAVLHRIDGPPGYLLL